MSIVFVVNNYPPHVGGVEFHVQALARHLVQRGMSVTVVALSDRSSTADEDGVHVIRRAHWLPFLGVMSFPRPGTLRELVRQFHSQDVTVVSTQTRFFPMSYLGGRLARRISTRHVHTEHGSGYVRGVALPIALASWLVDHTLGRWVLRHADAVLGVSDGVVDFVRELAGVSALSFPAAIELAPWVSARSSERAGRFVFVGRLVQGKGWDTLLDAVDLLGSRADRLPFQVDIVGGGPDEVALRVRVERGEFGERVRVHGRLEGESLRDVLTGAILVNPTTLSEGFQTTLIEAVAIGAQVVTFDVPGARSLVDDGAPVHITSARTAESLSESMLGALAHPLPDYPVARLAKWGWEKRSADFAKLVGTLVG